MWGKFNAFLAGRKDDVYVFLVIVLVALLSFGIGRLSVENGREGEFKILYPEEQTASVILGGSGGYVASKNGSTYSLPWCGTVSRIKPENLIRFATKKEAEQAGYQPSKTCSGL